MSLEDTYKRIANVLKNIGATCVVCCEVQNTRLHRSATCSPRCSTEFSDSSLSVRVADLFHDSNVVDLLLSTIEAAASKCQKDLLPNQPLRDLPALLNALMSLPSTLSLRGNAESHLWSQDQELHRLSKDASACLLWSISHYRGFLASATGHFRIPSMPNVHQFLLASTTPDLEREFASRLATRTPKVLFHGTSMDRLHRILCEGLRVCSGTSLQVHGAVSGKGIYVAEEPATALSYLSNWIGVGTGWQYSPYKNTGVLLGLAYAGTEVARGGVLVVSDPKMLILRYVFLTPVGFRAPIAGHVVPAMSSVFASLRSGSV